MKRFVILFILIIPLLLITMVGWAEEVKHKIYITRIEMKDKNMSEVIEITEGKILVNGVSIYESELLADACKFILPSAVAPISSEWIDSALIQTYVGLHYMFDKSKLEKEETND